MNWQLVAASALAWFRGYLFLSHYQWNSDIPNAILPALNCWYCVPSHAPYGLLWYIVDYPLKLFYTPLITMIDYLVMVTVGRYKVVFPIYMMASGWIWLEAPYDIPILWLTLLGLVKWPLALLGPLAKLPDSGPAWSFILSRSYATSDWIYYGLMGIVFLTVLASRIPIHWIRSRLPV